MAKSVINVIINAKTLGADQVNKLQVDLTGVQQAAERAAASLAKTDTHKVITACGALSSSLNGLVSSLDFATEGYRSFDAAMRAANTMAGKDAAGFEQMKDQITELGKQIPLTRDALANGLYQTISNGVPEDNWVSFLEKSAKSAVGGMADLGGVVTVTSTIIKNYGLAWDEAGAIQDKIQTTAKNGVTSFEQLQQALPRVTGNAATLGVSIDELMASFATLTGVSGNTAEVSTQLAAIFTALVKPSSEAGKMAEAMGIQFDAAAIKAAGGFQNFITQLDKSVKAYAQASGTLEQEVYGKLFGSAESLRALIPLTGELASKYAENVAAMEGSTGAIDAAFTDMAQTADSKAQLMKNAWAGAMDAIGSAVSAVKPALDFTVASGQFASGCTAVYAASTKVTASLRALATNARNATLQTRLLGASIKGLLISTGVGAAIVAAGMALSYFTGNADKAKQKAEELAQRTKQLKDTFTETYSAAASQARTEINEQIKSLKKLVDSHDDATQVVKDLNAKYGTLFGTYSTAAQWYDVLVSKSAEYVKAKGYEAVAVEAAGKAAKLQIELEKRQEEKAELERQKRMLKRRGKYFHGGLGAGGKYTAQGKRVASGIEEADEAIKALTSDLKIVNAELDRAQSKMQLPALEIPEPSGTDNGSGKSKNKDKTPAPEGSLKHIENQISDLNAKLKISVDEESRIELYKQIQALEDQKHVIEFKYEFSDAPDRPDSSVPSMFGQIETDIAKLNPQLEDVASKIENTTGKAKASTEDAAGAFANLGSSIAGLGNAVELPALNIAGTMMQAIANMVLAFSTAQTQSAALGPFGWMAFAATGLAQLTSMVASVKSLPAFADGGIAYGPTLGLFGEYAGAANNPEVVAPLDRLQSMIQPAGGAVAVTGTFRIRGRDLVAMIGNETSIASKSGKHTNIKL